MESSRPSPRPGTARRPWGQEPFGSRYRGSLVRALWLGLLLAGCHSPTPAPDVLFVTIDTLRADRVGVYGSTTARTPNIDRLAAQGAWFTDAVAPLPETRPSHFTLFTSRYPRDHGVVSNTQRLAEEFLTLAELYRSAGYATAAFSGTILLDRDSGAGQGFDLLETGDEPQRPSSEVLADVRSYLARASTDQPLFLWVHLFDPHMPYEPDGPEPRGATAADESETLPSVDDSTPTDPADWVRRLPTFTWPRLLQLAAAHDGDLPAGAVDRGRELYAGEVEVVDEAVGALRRLLEARGSWDRTLTLFTADHGECFEQGIYFEHSHCLGEGALAVPLILAGPGIEPGRRERVVEHLDVAPTLLRATGLEVPDTYLGRDLLLAGPQPAETAFFQPPVYPQEQIENRRDVLQRLRSAGGDPTRDLLGDRLQVGARRGAFKYLRIEGQEWLWNLDRDPEASHDLAAEEPELLLDLRRATREWLRDHPIRAVDSEEINPELRKKLEALGYLGGG